jgi:hypothetical protein
MQSLDIDVMLKLLGAGLAFVVGIWIGLGLPGLKDRHEPRRGRPLSYLHGTWLNRLFFGMPRPPRRFDSTRLLDPRKRARERAEREGSSDGKKEQGRKPVVRFRNR